MRRQDDKKINWSRYFDTNLAIFCLLSFFSCDNPLKKNKKKDISDTAPPTSVVAFSSGNIATLEVLVIFPSSPVDVETSAGLLRIKNIPDGAKLECDLSGQPLPSCRDGGALNVPKSPGSYRLNIFALIDQKIHSEGHYEFIVVAREKDKKMVTSPEDEKDPLKLDLKKITPEGIQWQSSSSEYVIPFTNELGGINLEFGFKNDNKCPSDLQTFCRLGSGQSGWVLCDSYNNFRMPKRSLGLGHHLAEVEARCGDRVGPRLKVEFQFVEEGYQSLSLTKITDARGKTLVYLQNDSDCLYENRRFECREGPEKEYNRCVKSNVFSDLKSPVEVRLRCGEAIGPAIKIDTKT